MNNTKILAVDDEPALRDGCCMILSEEGYSATSCGDGRTALESIMADPPDIVLLDLKLPDLDGLEVLRAVRQRRPDVAVIIMTGYATVQTAVEAMKLGAFDYLSKPFSDDELTEAVAKAVEAKSLADENLSLRSETTVRYGFDSIVGEHPRMLETFETITRAAPTDTTVLLCGESGTGKELFAKAIHTHSLRAERPFVAVDCSALASGILESELFGHVKGAFTGASETKAGVFEAADRGTLFLDEVANLSLDIQAKLLRVLETGELKPVGASRCQRADVRVVAATNRELEPLVEEGTFREDLFYRLSVLPIRIPPLRERREDIPSLAYYFLRYFCRRSGKHIEGFTDDALETLREYEWPGNVRQLRNVVERLVVISDREVLGSSFMFDHLPTRIPRRTSDVPETVEELNSVKQQLMSETFGQIQRAFLIKAIRACHGNITHASQRVGMKRANFSVLLKKHHIAASEYSG
jgi:DNA-binding NtrC family response regulator